MYLSSPPIFPAFWVACLACSLMMILWHIHIKHIGREREQATIRLRVKGSVAHVGPAGLQSYRICGSCGVVCCWRPDQQTAALGTQAGTKRETARASKSKQKRCASETRTILMKCIYQAHRYFLFFWMACLACSLMMILWHIHIKHIGRERAGNHKA